MSPDVKRQSSSAVVDKQVNQIEEDKYFISSKVVMLGESGVGKSSIVNNFINNQFMPGREQPTVSPHFIRKTQTIYKLGSHKV